MRWEKKEVQSLDVDTSGLLVWLPTLQWCHWYVHGLCTDTDIHVYAWEHIIQTCAYAHTHKHTCEQVYVIVNDPTFHEVYTERISLNICVVTYPTVMYLLELVIQVLFFYSSTR